MEMIPDKNDYVLVLTVGGSPEPQIDSIKHYRPRYGIFICSKGSYPHIKIILHDSESIDKFPFTYRVIVISDHQDLLSCVREIRTEIPEKLANMDLSPDILLIADFTGGTKVMSAALTLAMMEFKSRFSYVGGDKRAKGGLGTVVEDGQIYSMDNPWDVMGLREAHDLVKAFNSAQFGAAQELCNFLKATDKEFKAFYDGFGDVVEAYADWDRFNYRSAQKKLLMGLKKLENYNSRLFKNFAELYAKLLKDQEILEVLAADMAKLQGKFEPLAEGEGEAYLRDLFANAIRRGSLGQYDDAVARLYSVVEKAAKVALARKGINNSDVTREQLENMGEELIAQYSGIEEERIKLPLSSSFQALGALDPENPLSQAWARQGEKLAKALESRNLSLLAHGYNPVSEAAYMKLRDIALDFLAMEAEKLPSFPHVTISQVLY